MAESSTLQEFASARRERGLPTHVHVVGDLDADSPKGIATAKRVANILTDEDGTVREEDYDEIDDGDVAFVRIDKLSYEQRQEIRDLATRSRARCLGGIVVFTEQVLPSAEKLLNARVWPPGGDDRVVRLQTDSLEGEVYETELGGLV